MKTSRNLKLTAPTKKPIVLPPLHPNAGLEAAYRRKLVSLVDELDKSVQYWIKAAYRQNTPAMASDATPADVLRRILRRLATRWLKKIDGLAPALAEYFTNQTAKRVDGGMKSILKKHGFTIDFEYTPAMRDVMQATIGEQVGLIKSIGQQYFTEVEGLVMRSVASGFDMHRLSEDLQERYGITKRRANLIARDQTNKAHATLTRCRQQSLGITKAIWLHSHGGKTPRPSHVAADGKVYEIDKGMYLDGKWVWPGTEINCRCVQRPILPGL